MTFDSAASAREELAMRAPPGLYVGSAAATTVEPVQFPSGVPAFVGFAHVDPVMHRRSGPPGIELERWDSRLWSRGDLAPAPGSFLRAAVRGYFANGGKRCVIFAVPPPLNAGDGADALMQVLAPGGPLDDRSDIDLLCLPDAQGPWVTDNAARDVQLSALRHCEAMGDRFALLDAPMSVVSDVKEGDRREPAFRALLSAASELRSSFGALYGPWIEVDPNWDAQMPRAVDSAGWRYLDSTDDSAAGAASPASPNYMPPCGHIAGLVARIDAKVGAQHAPANEMLEGALDTALFLTPAQRGRLNEAGINCIHSVRGHGIRVGGARTLGSLGPWTYVSTARVVLGFRRWLALGMRDLVFEPQRPELWETIRNRLTARCLEMQQGGALAGGRSADAFYVKCDDETNPPEVRDLGRVIAHVGLAPSVPAEFIVIRIVHDASGFTVDGLS
ncbi:phage tail sheath family protein [Variovorax sp. GT1P44]|uniref:phage tail sheath family protein n=1 Tax=Variovorax sp. GT1P44 TaxID=3443742 RepID=UPI003F461778